MLHTRLHSVHKILIYSRGALLTAASPFTFMEYFQVSDRGARFSEFDKVKPDIVNTASSLLET